MVVKFCQKLNKHSKLTYITICLINLNYNFSAKNKKKEKCNIFIIIPSSSKPAKMTRILNLESRILIKSIFFLSVPYLKI